MMKIAIWLFALIILAAYLAGFFLAAALCVKQRPNPVRLLLIHALLKKNIPPLRLYISTLPDSWPMYEDAAKKALGGLEDAEDFLHKILYDLGEVPKKEIQK